MTTIELIRKQFEWSHEALDAVVADLTQEGSDYNELGKAIPAGAAYAHAVISEDMLISSVLAKKDAVMTDAESVGLSQPMPTMDKWDEHEQWYKTVKVDVAKFREYAKKVYQASDEYLSTLKDEDLIQEKEMFGMKNTLAYFLTNIFVLHAANLTGEISAAKGVQGLKGYQW